MTMMQRLILILAIATLAAGCASSYPSRSYGPPHDGYARCGNCGVVERVERVYGRDEASGGGAVVGGIIGGVLGNQIGSGSGRRAATVAGAIAGGVVGNEMERNANAAPSYELFVRMDDGRRLVVSQRSLDGIRQGSYVRLSGGRAYLQ